jgi:hypothetical protein
LHHRQEKLRRCEERAFVVRSVVAARRERERDSFPASDGVAGFPRRSAWIESGPARYTPLPNTYFFFRMVFQPTRVSRSTRGLDWTENPVDTCLSKRGLTGGQLHPGAYPYMLYVTDTTCSNGLVEVHKSQSLSFILYRIAMQISKPLGEKPALLSAAINFFMPA